MQRFLPFGTLMLLFVGLAIGTPHFLTQTNLESVVRQTAVINLMALGMTMVIVAGGIDLSVGSMMGLSGLVGTMAIASGAPAGVGIAAGVAVGFACGAANGAMTAWLGVNPFIVTLGTLGIYRGVALLSSKGLPVEGLPKSFGYLGEGSLLGVPFALWVVAACAALAHGLLEHTKAGRYAFAIGSNVEAARYSGVPVSFYTMTVYALCGLLTGLAGMMETSRLMTGQPTAGQGYELQAIAAVVIGGGSLRGGEGSVVGTLVGALIMGLLSNGSDLLGISPYLQQAIVGTVIIAAVFVDEVRKRRVSS
jgi:ribose transport system permease protein